VPRGVAEGDGVEESLRRLRLLDERLDLAREAVRPGRAAELVGHDAQRLLGIGEGEAEHRLGEVLPMRAVEPGRAQDRVAASGGGDGLLALELGLSVHRRGARGVRFEPGAWRLAPTVEDVVRGDVHEIGAGFAARFGEDARALRVDGAAERGVGFRLVDGGVGGAVDDGVGVEVRQMGSDGGRGGDVDPRDVEREDLVRGERRDAVVAKLAVAPGDQDSRHGDVPQRALRMSAIIASMRRPYSTYIA